MVNKVAAEPLELTISGKNLIELMQEILSKGSDFRFKASGSSMWPFIKSGDIVTVSPCSGKQLKTGNIIAFRGNRLSQPVIHRIVGTQKGYYLVKGDSRWKYDGLIHSNDIFGKVTKVEEGNNLRQLGVSKGNRLIAYVSRVAPFSFSLYPLRLVYEYYLRWKLING